jgi:hypothetical protein
MYDDQEDYDLGVRAQRNPAASTGQAEDFPNSVRNLVRALAHLVLAGSVLWTVAVAACLAHSL